MPLSTFEAQEYLRAKGLNPAEYDVDPFTTEITPRVKVQPALTSEAKKPSYAETFGRTTAMGVIPSVVSIPAGIAAGSAATTAALPLAAVPIVGPVLPPLVGLGAGLVAGGVTGAATDWLQNKVLGQSKWGQDVLEKTTAAREENPITAAIGNVASSLPVMTRNPAMLKDAFHALTTERAAGAGLLNKLATSQAAQQVVLGGGLGGVGSVVEDVMADKDVNITKAAVNALLQGTFSDVRKGVASRVPGLRGAHYEGQPLGAPARETMQLTLRETTVPGVVPDLAMTPEAVAKRATNEFVVDSDIIMRQRELAARDAELAKQDHEVNLAEKDLQLETLKRRKAAIDAELKRGPDTVTKELVASPEMLKFGAAKTAQKSGPDAKFTPEDTGPRPTNFGSFDPNTGDVKASIHAATLDNKGKMQTYLPEGLITTVEGQTVPRASTVIHEPVHAEIHNILNSESVGQTRMGAQLQAAVEGDKRFADWKAATNASGKTWDEFATREATKSFLSDPSHSKRSWREERAALERLRTGKASAADAVRILEMKFRYDSGTVAPRLKGAAMVHAGVKNATPLEDAYKAELARKDKEGAMEQTEFPKTAQQGTPLSKLARDLKPLPEGTFEPRKGQLEMRLSEPSVEPSIGAKPFYARVKSEEEFYKFYPGLRNVSDKNKWSSRQLAAYHNVTQPAIVQANTRAKKAGREVDWNNYEPKSGVEMIRNPDTGKMEAAKNEQGEIIDKLRFNRQLRQDEFQPDEMAMIEHGVNLRFNKATDRTGNIARGREGLLALNKDYKKELLQHVVQKIQEGGIDTAVHKSALRNIIDTASRITGQKMVRDHLKNVREGAYVKRSLDEAVAGGQERGTKISKEDIAEPAAKLPVSEKPVEVPKAVPKTSKLSLRNEAQERPVKDVRDLVDELYANKMIDEDLAANMHEDLSSLEDGDMVNMKDFSKDWKLGDKLAVLREQAAEHASSATSEDVAEAHLGNEAELAKLDELNLSEPTAEPSRSDEPPKTDVSGRLYDISRPVARRESGEQMTLGGKQYSEPSRAPHEAPFTPEPSDETKQGWTRFTTAQADQVQQFDPHVAQKFRDTAAQQDEYEGRWLNLPKFDFLRAFRNLDERGSRRAYDYGLAKYRETSGGPAVNDSDYTPQEIAAAKFVNDRVMRPIRETQQELDMKVETRDGYRREAHLSEWYMPQMLNPETLRIFTKSTDSVTAQEAKQKWARYVADESGGTVSYAEALDEIAGYVAALGRGGKGVAEFGALRKSAGFGMPEEFREKNLARVIERYARRASKDVSIFQHLESDEHTRQMLHMKDPETGKTDFDPEHRSLLEHEEVKKALQMIRGDIEVAHAPRTLALSRVVTNAILGPLSGLRDTMTVAANSLPYARSIGDYSDIVTSIMRIPKEWRASMEAGARTGEHRLTKVDTIAGIDAITDNANRVSEMLRKYSGRDIIEQVNRGWTFTIGKQMAERAVREDNTRFLNKFGAIAKDADGNWDTNKLAKSFVDSVQGTYDVRGLPAVSVDGMAAPWFALSRWSLEKSNAIYKDVIKPAYKGDVQPLLAYALGTFLSGAAIEAVVEMVNNGKKSQDATFHELDAANADTDKKIARFLNVLQLGSFAGMFGDMLKIGSDIYQGQPVRGYSVPMADLVSQGVVNNVTNFTRAVRDGADPIDSTGILIQELLKNQSQVARIAMNWTDDDEVARKNRFRDLRAYKIASGEEVPGSFTASNAAFRPEERALKHADTAAEVADLLPKIVDDLVRKHGDNPAMLRKALERLKQNSYQTFPNPRTDKAGAAAYYQYLVRSVGQEEADRRLDDFAAQTGLNKGKSRIIHLPARR